MSCTPVYDSELHVSRQGGKQQLSEECLWTNGLQSFCSSSSVQKFSIWLIFMHAAAIICTSFSLFFAQLSCHLAKNSKSNVKIVLSASIKGKACTKKVFETDYICITDLNVNVKCICVIRVWLWPSIILVKQSRRWGFHLWVSFLSNYLTFTLKLSVMIITVKRNYYQKLQQWPFKFHLMIATTSFCIQQRNIYNYNQRIEF